MQKFADYPVIVNYNLHTRLRNERQETALHQAKQYTQERDLIMKVSRTSDASLKEFLWKQELEEFEKGVCALLQKIAGCPVGRKVLDLINKQTTVWIIPKSDDELKVCSCALTSPLNYDIPKDGSYAYGSGYGDTVILYNTRLDDDTLLHELVHAYRYSNKKYKESWLMVDNDGDKYRQNIEEFFAHEIENVYHSQMSEGLTKDYKKEEPADKDKIYDFLALNLPLINAMKTLLQHDTLASTAACCFAADYNPFRDCAEIEARYKQYKAMLGDDL